MSVKVQQSAAVKSGHAVYGRVRSGQIETSYRGTPPRDFAGLKYAGPYLRIWSLRCGDHVAYGALADIAQVRIGDTMTMIHSGIVGALLLATIAACSHSASAPVPSRADVVTGGELAATHEASAYDAIRAVYSPDRMRRPVTRTEVGPQTLNAPDEQLPVAYVDDQPYGPFSSLRKISTSDVDSVRFFDRESTGLRFGAYPGNERGVIDVFLKQ